jgi:hypothetical protein
MNPEEDDLMTRRDYLLYSVLLAGADIWTATEAVYSTVLTHPEWQLDEKKTWDEWSKL